MRGPRRPQYTSTDDPAAIRELPYRIPKAMTCHQFCISFIPDENVFGVSVDPEYTLVYFLHNPVRVKAL